MIKRMLLSPIGADLIALLEEEYGQQTSFSADPYLTAFKEGQRSVLLLLNEFLKD